MLFNSVCDKTIGGVENAIGNSLNFRFLFGI
jgi:hypothetical protein